MKIMKNFEKFSKNYVKKKVNFLKKNKYTMGKETEI